MGYMYLHGLDKARNEINRESTCPDDILVIKDGSSLNKWLSLFVVE